MDGISQNHTNQKQQAGCGMPSYNQMMLTQSTQCDFVQFSPTYLKVSISSTLITPPTLLQKIIQQNAFPLSFSRLKHLWMVFKTLVLWLLQSQWSASWFGCFSKCEWNSLLQTFLVFLHVQTTRLFCSGFGFLHWAVSWATSVIVEMAPGPAYLEHQSNPIWPEKNNVLKLLCWWTQSLGWNVMLFSGGTLFYCFWES